MYIPEGFLSTKFIIISYLIMFFLLFLAIRRSMRVFHTKFLPIVIWGSIFVLLLRMIEMPLYGEINTSIMGAAVLSLLLGPWTSFIIITFALMLKVLILSGQGITALAVNSLCTAYTASFAAYFLFRWFISVRVLRALSDQVAMATVSGYLSLIFAASFAAIIIKLGIIYSYSTGNIPLYLDTTANKLILATFIKNFLIYGILEGILTGGLYLITAKFSLSKFARNVEFSNDNV